MFAKKAGGKVLAAVGALGIACTFLLYGALFYFGFVHRGGVYDDLRARLAQINLNSLVQAIEFYKITHGEYPDSLEGLRMSLPENSLVIIFDPMDTALSGGQRYFYYERTGSDHYYVRAVGVDGQPFTPDDVLPQISPESAGRTGLLIGPPAPASDKQPGN